MSRTGWDELGQMLGELAQDQAEWSRATFGGDSDRGPIGALKHLEKEAREAQLDPDDFSEYADCFLLILDASRRAGMGPRDLLRAAMDKMSINRARTWPKPRSNEPVEHVK